MADRHRIGTFVNGRFTTSLDLAPSSGVFAVERDTFTITPPVQTDIKARNARRYGGSRKVGELHDNGNLAAQWFIKGANLQATLVQLDSLLALLEATSGATTPLYWEWRPDGATYSTYFEVRGTSWEPLYRWVQTAGTGHLHVKLGVDIAPLALGDQLDIYDNFTVDTITAGDWTFDQGAAGNITTGGGILTVGNVAEQRFYHSARGYQVAETQGAFKYTIGASTAAQGGVILKRIDVNNALWVQFNSGTMNVVKRIAGVNTTLSTTAITVAAGGTYWLRGRIEGNVVTVEHWASEPTAAGTPTLTTTVILTTAEAAVLGASIIGAPGLRFSSMAADWTFTDVRFEPYTYSGRLLPETIDLRSVPGTAPAQFDLRLSQPPSNPRVESWGLVGWTQRPPAHNYIWNGDFEDATIGVDGWVTGNPSTTLNGNVYLTNAGAVISRVTANKQFGTGAMQIVADGAHTNEGAGFRFFRRMKKGYTYTFSFWALNISGATSWQFWLGELTSSTGVASATAVTSGAWTQFTLTWQAVRDIDAGFIAIRQVAAAASTIVVDGVQVYEGTVAPTIGKHPQGAGGQPAFGIVSAEGAIPSTLVGWAITLASGTALGNYDLTVASATAASAEWLIDPALNVADDFTGDITIDVYARMAPDNASAAATATLSAIPENNIGQRIYTAEWGSAGKSVVLPNAGGSVWRMVRLGTITLPVDAANPSRWRLKLALAGTSNGVLALDYLLLAPARQRALGPTSKPNDATYPTLFHTSGVEELKVIRSDLSGRYGLPPGPLGRDSGLGGQLLELPAPPVGSSTGDVQTIVKLSDVVPDDPTSSAYVENALTVNSTLHFAVQPRYLLTRTA